MALRHARVHGPLSLSPDLLEGLLWGQDRFLSSLTAANLAMLAGNRTATRLRPTIEKKLSHAGSWRARFTAALALCNLDPQNLDAHKTLLRSIPELTLAYPDAFAIHLALSRVEQKPRTNARALYAVAAAALRRTNDRSLLATLLSYLNLIHGESFYVPAHRVVEIRDEWLKKLER